MSSAPAQQEMQPVLLTEDRYLKPDPTTHLAKITRDEAVALLKVNSSGVTEFFNRKGCSTLAQALGKEGVNGETLSQLTPKYVEQLPVALGDKLALLAFMNRFRSAARAGKRSEVIWQGDDYAEIWKKLHLAPCCGLCEYPDGCLTEPGCCEKPRAWEHLPLGSYKLTNTTFKRMGYTWADGTAEQAREVDFTPICGAGCLFGWRRGRKFVYTEATNNIDLGDVLDVDVQGSNFKEEEFTPRCEDQILGYTKHLLVRQPAKVFLTYITPQGETERITLSVSPEEDPQKIADEIIAAKEEAQAEDSGAGKVDM